MSGERRPLLGGSTERMWKLIDDRTQTGADTAVIDQRIWDLFGENWSILFTDLSGFSRQVAEFGVIHFLQIIHEHKKLLLPIVEAHDGILVKIEGDSFLILLKRAKTALLCAIEMQHACQKVNARRLPEEQILLCAGIGAGPVLKLGDEDVYGAEVNAACKLGEDTAKSNEILITEAAREQVGPMADVSYEKMDVIIPGTDLVHRVLYPMHGA